MTADVERMVAALVADPPGWVVDDDGKLWPPGEPHGTGGGHRFAGGCAICRAGDHPKALTALVSRIIELVTAEEAQ